MVFVPQTNGSEWSRLMTSGLIESCSNATLTKYIKRQVSKNAGRHYNAIGNDAFGQHPCQIGSTTATGNLTGALCQNGRKSLSIRQAVSAKMAVNNSSNNRKYF